MTRHLVRLAVIAALTSATPAYADLKCGDAPFAFGENDLVVTWIGPVPKGARVRYADEKVFELIERQLGRETALELPDKYRKGLHYVDLANAHVSTSVREAEAWLKRYHIDLESGPSRTFQGYIDRGNVIFSTLIEHPPVPNFPEFKACSIILQWGIIVINEGHETLYLRSYFHSSDGKGSSVNFAPRGGLRINFPSKTAWFPLELTKYIYEPAAAVVLDVVTATPKKLNPPAPFRTDNMNVKISFGAQDYFVTRIKGTLERGKDWPDLSLQIGN
jgi:hypothetical protein